jgi:hypothetical protein
MNSTKRASGVCKRGNDDGPVTLHLTRAQLETAIRLASKSGSSPSLMKKLIVARAQADYLRSRERAARLKNWQ